MSWVKLDDAIGEHRKVVALEEREALCGWLNVKAIAWSNRQLEDGVVPKAIVRRLASTFLGRIRIGQQVVTADDLTSALVAVGIWYDEGDAIRIHDYLKYQPSKREVEDKRAKDAERKRDGRGNASSRSPAGVHADVSRSPLGQTAESSPPDPIRPDPTRSVPSESEMSVVSLSPRGTHRISPEQPLNDATAAIYRLRECRNLEACHRDFVEQKIGTGEHSADWHAVERRWAQRHDERALCMRPSLKKPSRRDLGAEGREKREAFERERAAKAGAVS